MSNQKEDQSTFIKRLYSFSIGPIINTLIGFISVLTTTWFLIPEELGKAAMYTTAVEVISSVVFLGLLRSHAREYKSEQNRAHLLYNCLLIPMLISVVIVIFSLLFRTNISILLFGEYSILGVVLFSITMPIKVINRFSASVIRMEENGKLYSFHQILQKVVSYALLLGFFLFITPTYHAVVLASLGSILISGISQIFFMWDIWKDIFKQKPDLTLLKRILSFGVPLVPVAALMWVFNSADKIALRQFSNFEELGYYSGAFKIVALLNVLKKSFVNFWSPTSYRWYESGESIKKFQKVSDYLIGVFVVFAAVIIFFKGFIFIILSEKYLPSKNVFPFLMFIPIMSTVSESTMVGIQFKRKTHYQIYASVIVAIFNILGNLIMVPRYGAIGASISTGLSYILFFYIRSYYSNRFWEKFNLQRHTINIVLLFILSSFSILNNRLIWVEIIITAIIILYNFHILMHITQMAIVALKKRRKKS